MKLQDPHSQRDGGQEPAGSTEDVKKGSAIGDAVRARIDAVTVEGLTRDALKATVDGAMAPLEEPPPPDESRAGWAIRMVRAGMSLVSLPEDLAGVGLAMATTELAAMFPALPAVSLLCPHLGTPHLHGHPPAMPAPLPSFGVLALGACMSVLINGVPAGRAGDLGIAVTCGTLSPPFQIVTGSSKVFIGGARAARMFDLTKHCQPGEREAGRIEPTSLALEGLKLHLGLAGAGGAEEEAAESGREAEEHDATARASESQEEAAEQSALARSSAMAAAGHALDAQVKASQAGSDAVAAVMAMLMGKDPGVPGCIGMMLLGWPSVRIGGFPVPPLLDTLGGLFKLIGGLGKKLRDRRSAGRLHAWVAGKFPHETRARTLLHKAVCYVTGHPVDVIAGRLLTDAVDFELPGPIPLRLERNYDSAWSGRRSPVGFGWSHSLDQAVWREPGQVVIRTEDGRELEVAWSEEAARGKGVFDPLHRVSVRGLAGGGWSVRMADGLERVFAPVAGGGAEVARLVEIREPAGSSIRLEYDGRGRLEWAQDSGGRRVRFVHDEGGRLVEILLPHPDHEGLIGHVRYEYDEAGDLVRVVDALGHAGGFAYENHKMVRETLRGGLSFWFEYDGWGPEARCVRTWGDGGIYDHRLVYDAARQTTVVTNSCGETAVYRAGERGVVCEVVDPRGGVSRYEHDAWLRRTAEVDPLGHVTRFAYDARGNCTRVVGPDGATIEVTYNAEDQPIAAVDAVGGRWAWAYDESQRLVAYTDPLGQTTKYSYRGRWPAGLIEPGGREVRLEHDAAGDLIGVELPGGGRVVRRYDRRGRVREVVDVGGDVERVELDLLGRIVAVRGADGAERAQAYDAAGNLVRVRAGGREVVMTYTGLRRLASRSEAGTTVCFEYDTEGRLRAVTHELGAVYRFELDKAGDLRAEYGFDGPRRLYVRDAAGRIVEAYRPGGLRTCYEYDAAGEIVAVSHSDGSGDRFVYRADGELIEARHREPGAEEVVVRLERDLLGRVVREWQGGHWVASRYGRDGLGAGVWSALGGRQEIARGPAGDVTRIEADGWSAEFMRDVRGLEVERRLPGGVRSMWQRDALGRPVGHRVERAARPRLDGEAAPGLPSRVLRGVGLVWGGDRQLRRIDDRIGGTTELGHDARGFLVSSVRGGDAPVLRLSDALGNLFRREDRGDRRYGPAGELLAADGVSYAYDAEGNLVRKTLADGAVWKYQWSASGTLIAVVRPDGEVVRFAYDALGRRVWKEFRGRRTRWLWDGDVLLHEWTCAVGADEPTPLCVEESAAPEELARRAANPAIGPPCEVLTWLFEPDGFAPLARLSSRERRGASVVCDHLGTPVALVDADGEVAWSAELDVYGQVEGFTGARGYCPFRFPGQYEDEETGLYYNRFRYYDPAGGLYVAQDPLGLLAGTRLYGYVRDPSRATDVFGLEEDCVTFYHKADSWQSARAILHGIDLGRGGPNLDFNPRGRRGFYVTASLKQARRWKTRSSAIVVFKVPRSELAQLKGKVFRGPSREWERFVRSARAGRLRHDYDFVEGPLLLNPRQPYRPAWARGHQVAIFSDEAVEVFNDCEAWIL